MVRRPTHSLWLVISFCFLPLHASAGGQTITATGEYRMGEYDTLPEAQRLALVTAKSQALEQAVAYIDTVSAVKQLGLNQEELRAYSVGLLNIRQYPSRTTSAEAATRAVRLGPGSSTHRTSRGGTRFTSSRSRAPAAS